MARKYADLARQARERYNQQSDGDQEMAQDTMNVAPPMAKKAQFLRDADGTIYPWVTELAARGDLVAAYDPEKPDAFAEDQAQIALNRELEIAKERADAEEVARLEAQKRAEEEAAKRAEAEQIAQANQRNLTQAQEALARQEEEHAKKIAELQAQIDAMAKQQAEVAVEAKAPKAKAKKVEKPEPVAEEQINFEEVDD
nr:MAG TPA: hypothetical protein [Caudoviricetes sp.]